MISKMNITLFKGQKRAINSKYRRKLPLSWYEKIREHGSMLAARLVGCRQFNHIWLVKSFITKKINICWSNNMKTIDTRAYKNTGALEHARSQISWLPTISSYLACPELHKKNKVNSLA